MRHAHSIGSILLALGIASAAVAMDPPAGGGGGNGGDTPPKQGGGKGGSKDGQGGKGVKRPDFKTLDKNGDGFITSDEVPATAWERMKKADKDGDGKVSEAELKDFRPQRGPGGKGSGDAPAKKADEPKKSDEPQKPEDPKQPEQPKN